MTDIVFEIVDGAVVARRVGDSNPAPGRGDQHPMFASVTIDLTIVLYQG